MPLMTLRLPSGGRPRPRFSGCRSTGNKIFKNTPLDLRQIAAAQGCLLESAALNQNEFLTSIDFVHAT
jgi:hypothetical protein